MSNYSPQNLLYQKFRWTHGCTRFMYEGLEAIMVAGGRVNFREDALESVEILGRYFISNLIKLNLRVINSSIFFLQK